MAHDYLRPFHYCLVVATLISIPCVLKFIRFPRNSVLLTSSTSTGFYSLHPLPQSARPGVFNESSANSWETVTNSASSTANAVKLISAQTCPKTSLVHTSHETCRGKKLEAGYVLVLTNWEQTVAGAANFMSLQCWAATLNMVVVEPFLDKSYYNIPNEILLPNTSTVSSLIRLDDIYDIQFWNDYSKRNCYSPLVRWDEFICHAPKEMIIVHIAYADYNKPWELQKCPQNVKYTKSFTHKYTAFFSAHNFTTIRELCLATNRRSTTKEFNSFILGPNEFSKTTVVINQWRGASGETYRDYMKDTTCHTQKFYSMDFALPSAKIMEDTKKYQEQFLGSQDYIAVMLRLEFTYREMKTKLSTDCLKGDLYSLITDMTINQNRKYKIFWSLDIGRFGSYSYEYTKLSQPNVKFKQFFNEVSKVIAERYNVSYSEVEDSLFRVSGETNIGYIARLQANIAVRAKCLLLVGGGTFQGYAKKMYERLHQNMPHCIRQVGRGWLKKQCAP